MFFTESNLSAGLDSRDDDEGGPDPFGVQERIFSKYAAMLYTSSNNGKTYHELQGSLYCDSCREKVIGRMSGCAIFPVETLLKSSMRYAYYTTSSCCHDN